MKAAINTRRAIGEAKMIVMATENQRASDLSPIAKALLEWAEYWYPISWKGVLVGGVITAVGACATIAFLLLQWRTTAIREEHSEWRTSSLELQTATAKTELGKTQADMANANKAIEQARAETAEAKRQTAGLEKETATARLELERVRNQLAARRVSRAQAEIIIQSLAAKSVAFSEAGWATDHETQQFAGELWLTLSQAGAKLNQSLPKGTIDGFGLILSAPDNSSDLAHVAKALTEANIPFNLGRPTPHLQMFVGPKPPLTFPTNEPR